MKHHVRRAFLFASAAFVGCGGTPAAGVATPDLATAADLGVAPDLATASAIDTAQAKYPDLRTFWGTTVDRTCGPNSGVCHNSRQFPDMQTASGLLSAVNARCNQIRDSAAAIDNLCEPAGDELQIGSFVTRIGSVTGLPAGATPTSIVLTLKEPIPTATAPDGGLPGDGGAKGDGGAAAMPAMAIVRAPAGLTPISFAIPPAAIVSARPGNTTVTLAYAPLTNAKTAPGPAGPLATFLVPPAYVPGDATQVELGDPNGDGVFGADLGGALIKPGDPMKSYLFLRILAPLTVGPGQTLTNVAAPASQEAQMPIANFQYWDIDNAATALYCWISRMQPDGSNADGPIDYAHCDLSHAPKPMHQGGEATTFSSVYSTILAPSCAGPCHHTGTSEATTFFMDDAASAYDVLLGIRGNGPSQSQAGLPFVTKADPNRSYLYLKVLGAPTIQGARMPIGGSLSPMALDAIGTWIAQGANDN